MAIDLGKRQVGVIGSCYYRIGEQVEDLGAVVFGGAGAGADGAGAGLAEQAGDDNRARDSHGYGEPPALI